MGRGRETDTEWRQRASDAASEALLGVQHALRRERRDRAAEVDGLRQRIKDTPEQQQTVRGLEQRIARLEARNERLEARLAEANAEAETLELNNLKLDAAREVILTHARAFVRDHGLDDAAMLARMQTGLNEAFAGLDSAGEDHADTVQESHQREQGLDHGD